MKKYYNAFLKVGVSILLFSILIWKFDFNVVISNFRGFDNRYTFLIVLFLLLNYVISSYRWKILLSIYENTHKIKLSYLTILYFVGSFFNNFMPTSIGGDVFKVVKLGQKIDNKSNAFSATFMERFTGIIALLIVSCISLIEILGFLGALLFVGFWISAVVSFFLLKYLSKKIKKLESIFTSLIKYKGQNKVLMIAFISSFGVQLLAIFTQYFIFSGMGINLPLFYALFVFPVITLASFFIPSLNGVGVQDALYVQLLAPIGVAPEIALSASIIYHLFRLAVSLIGGVLYAAGKAD